VNAFGQDLGSTRDVMKNKDYGVAPEVKFGIGTPTEITLSALIQHNRAQPDYGVPSLNGGPAPVGVESTIRACLDAAGFSAADIDAVGYSWAESFVDQSIGNLYFEIQQALGNR